MVDTQGVDADVRDLAGPQKRLANKSDIREFSWASFWITTLIVGVMAYFIWYLRINAFAKAVAEYRNAKPDFDAARDYILGDGGGNISIFALISTLVLMFFVWYNFTQYLYVQNFDDVASEYDASKQRVMAELHDPPGDIFTLIGIAATFAGLALSMTSIPGEVISNVLASGSETEFQSAEEEFKYASRLMSAAIVFGCSLAIGLLASLQGITLSLLARIAAAKFSNNTNSSVEYSDHIGKLSLIARAVSDLRKFAADLQAKPQPKTERKRPVRRRPSAPRQQAPAVAETAAPAGQKKQPPRRGKR